MPPFVIVADLRTGSTLLSSSLDLHPEIRCYGEVFHPDDFDDNQLDQTDRHQLNGRAVIRHIFGDPDEQGRAVGFRAMIFLPLSSALQWNDAWQALGDVDDLKVIHLSRRNRLAQYASMLVAEQTRTWHPSPNDPVLRPENRPAVVVDPDDFVQWTRQRDELAHSRLEMLSQKRAMHVDYESLAADWPAETRRIQQFLRVRPRELEQVKQVQERRPLSEVIQNYNALTAAARSVGGEPE